MPDQTNQLLADIKSALQAASSAGELKDGNIPVKNIWDNLNDSNIGLQHLPLIQFGVLDGSPAGIYISDTVESVSFFVRFICWVQAPADRAQATVRARNLRQALVNLLHNRKPFSGRGASRASLTMTRETEPYRLQKAVGAGLAVSGDLWNPMAS